MPECTLLKGDEAVEKLRQFDSQQVCPSFFQTHNWLRFWNTRTDFEASVLIVHERGEMLGYFPLCIREHHGFSECLSMPMGTYGGVVAVSGARKAVRDVVSEWIGSEDFSRVNITEFSDDPIDSLEGYEVTRHITHVLDLESYDAPESLSENHRRNLKKARKSDFEIVTVEDESRVSEYFDLVRQSAGRHKASPTYALDFYHDLRKAILSDHVTWRLVLLDGAPCAGHIYFIHCDNAFYWDGCASEAGLETSANYFLFDESISGFIDLGCKTLNFGSGPSGADQLIRFKEGWGAEKVTYFEYDMQSAAYRSARRLKGWLRR